MKEEIKLLKREQPEGYIEDEATRYYLACGKIEEMIRELRESKEISNTMMTAKARELDAVNKQIKEMTEIVEKLEEEIAENQKTPAELNIEWNEGERRELNEKRRLNKILMRSMKKELQNFLHDTEELQGPGNQSTMGHLLQALWNNFSLNGQNEWLSIEGLDFDVLQPELEQLIRAGIVLQNPNNSDGIKLEDFTMTT